MAIEIERKFLLAGEAWRDAAHAVVPMVQGYLNDYVSPATPVGGGRAQGASVRVRIAGESAFLNLKSRELGRRRQEFEYPIPVEDAHALLALCGGGTVDKRRYLVRHGAHLWEIDEFLGDNRGLLVAEVELAAVDAAFERPAWLGREVTDLPRYYNLALAARPFAGWSESERRADDAAPLPAAPPNG